MLGKALLASAVLFVASGSAMAGHSGSPYASASHSDVRRVVMAPVGSARTLVPVHVVRSDTSRPYALTGRVESPRLEPIYVGSRIAGMRVASQVHGVDQSH